MTLNENRFRKWMVTLAAASLLVAIVRLWIGVWTRETEAPRSWRSAGHLISVMTLKPLSLLQILSQTFQFCKERPDYSRLSRSQVGQASGTSPRRSCSFCTAMRVL